MRRILLVILVASLAGCRTAGPRTEVYRTAFPPVTDPAGVVFVANGSGDSRTVSTNLSYLVAESCLPLWVEPHVWSTGYGRNVIDHVDHANHLAQGRLLAERVAASRRAYPCRKIYLVGYSSGCAVVLAAAEILPPGSIDRIVLLSPSVCACYDLRAALLASRGGIDSFYSERDRFILGPVVGILGTSDRACRTAAGRYGFTPVITAPADAVLYAGLRQHAWDAAAAQTGHDGGHFGSTRAGFLRAYVLPLLAGARR
jgi:pimeloyl-ACP methyl ester carboxylesterase